MSGGRGNVPRKPKGPWRNKPGNSNDGAPGTVPKEPEVTVMVQDLFNIIRISKNKASFNPQKLCALIERAEKPLKTNRPESQYVTQDQFRELLVRLDEIILAWTNPHNLADMPSTSGSAKQKKRLSGGVGDLGTEEPEPEETEQPSKKRKKVAKKGDKDGGVQWRRRGSDSWM